MDWYDIAMLAVLGLATLMGAWKGMAWQLASLGSLILSYFLALRFSAQLAPIFGSSAPWNRFIAMLVIYLVTSVVVWLMFRVVARFMDKIKLRDFDHQVGACSASSKGCYCAWRSRFSHWGCRTPFASTFWAPSPGITWPCF